MLRANDDVVDGDVNELDEEADEAHDRETDGRGNGDLLEFWKRSRNCRIRLVKLKLKVENYEPFRSGFVHLLTSLMESLEKTLTGSMYCTIWSIMLIFL